MPGMQAGMAASGPGWNVQSLTGTQQGNVNDPSLWAQVMVPELAAQQQPFPYQAQQQPFPGGQQQPFPYQAQQQPFPGEQQQAFPNMQAPAAPPIIQASPGVPQQAFPEQPSMLPVPYQGPQGFGGMPNQSLMVLPQNQGMTGALVPVGQGPLLPAIPTEEEAVYIPPMYTKPRPTIPRYRVISGLLSVIIVVGLLCSGGLYFAKATGKLSFLRPLFGGVPVNINAPQAANLPDPAGVENGPAADVITSATTASKIDPHTAIALQPSQVFTPGQIIYLTYSIHPRTKGTVVIKWYTNNNPYRTQPVNVTPDPKGGSLTVSSSMLFTQPLEGKIELYWNDKGTDVLAKRLYFVVR